MNPVAAAFGDASTMFERATTVDGSNAIQGLPVVPASVPASAIPPPLLELLVAVELEVEVEAAVEVEVEAAVEVEVEVEVAAVAVVVATPVPPPPISPPWWALPAPHPTTSTSNKHALNMSARERADPCPKRRDRCMASSSSGPPRSSLSHSYGRREISS
jgi:hypothetical protein